MLFVVFSYNRGVFLDHCVGTIERCAPDSPVWIYDDGSDDPETCAVLARLGRRHRVVVAAAGGSRKHGRLHANMQAAYAAAEEHEHLCLLQDDMQLVRPLAREDFDGIRDFFRCHPAAGFLHPCFLKGCNRRRDRATTRYDASGNVYFRRAENRSAGVFYADVAIVDRRRLHERKWSFGEGEADNEARARALFSPMGFMYAPFAMWLPYVPAYRGKMKTWALRFAEKRCRAGFYPHRILDAAACQALTRRDPTILPVAEDFIAGADANLPTPWRYHPLQGARLLRALDRLEQGWRARVR